MKVRVEVDDDGVLSFKDANGTPLDERFIRAAKRQQGDAIRGLIQKQCDEINAGIEALGAVHIHTPDPADKPSYDVQEYEVSKPTKPPMRGLGLWGRLFAAQRRKIDDENAAKLKTYQAMVGDWESEKIKFDAQEEERKQFVERRIYSEHEAMELFLEENLKDIEWPRETKVDFEVSEDGKRVSLEVDLPEIEDMPRKQANVPQRGYKLTVKELSDAKVRLLYLQHIHGIGFRIIGETFRSLPLVDRVQFAAYSQRSEKATGQIHDEYLYSVRVSREKWSEIKFGNLESLDVIAAFEQFDLRRDMKKTGVMTAIFPFEDN